MTQSRPETKHFLSVHDPDGRPLGAVYAVWFITPFAVCMLPVMIGMLLAVLEGYPVFPYAIWASAAAFLGASLWTSFRMKSTIARVLIDSEWVALESVWDRALRNEERSARRPQVEWRAVLDMKDYGSWLHATIGLSSYEFDREDWPEYARLSEALQRARRGTLSRPLEE